MAYDTGQIFQTIECGAVLLALYMAEPAARYAYRSLRNMPGIFWDYIAMEEGSEVPSSKYFEQLEERIIV